MPETSLTRADRYRIHSQKCARLAHQTIDQEMRKAHLYASEQWLMLADDAERTDRRARRMPLSVGP